MSQLGKKHNWSPAARAAQSARARAINFRRKADRISRLATTPLHPMPQAASQPAPDSPPILTVLDGGPSPNESHGAEIVAAEIATVEPRPAGEVGAPVIHGTGRHNIHWKAAEMKQVADALADLILKEGWRHVPPTGDRVGRNMLTDMLATAQLVLDRSRRRLRASPTMFKANFWALVEVTLTAKAQTKALATTTPSEPTAEKGTAPASAPSAPVSPPSSVLRPLPALDQIPTAALISAALSRLLESMGANEATVRRVAELEAKHQKQLDAVMVRFAELENRITSTPAPEERKKLPRVAILGCRLYEMEHIRDGCKAAGLALDFRHYDQDQAPRQFQADYAISLKWLNHSWDDQCKRAVPSADHYKFLNGGVGTAIQQLKTWFAA